MRIGPRPKLSVRGLMLVIAGFALGIVADEYRHRYSARMEKARKYEARAKSGREYVKSFDALISRLQGSLRAGSGDRESLDVAKAERGEARQRAERAESLRAQFERAAYLQFLPMPDESAYLPVRVTVSTRPATSSP